MSPEYVGTFLSLTSSFLINFSFFFTEELSGDKSEESGAFESGQASGELSGEASGESSGQVSGELGWEPSGQSMGQSSLPEESSGSGSEPSYEID
nr:chondroitin proteoglycan 3-like isoform X1 [Chrysemys picta bellii]